MAVKSHVGQVIVAMAPSDELVAISNEADITINPSSFHIFALITIFFSIFPKIDRITFAHLFSFHLSTNKSRVDAKNEFDVHRNLL